MRHAAEGGNWTRDYQYEIDNNRLKQTQIGKQVFQYPHHEQHGFIETMPHLQRMDWNFRDELQAVAKQKVSEGSIPETTYYVYDAKGQRVRKITENNSTEGETATQKKERLYLGTLEIYREHSGKNKGLERSSLHVTEYFYPESKIPEDPEIEDNKPLTEEEQKTDPTLGAEDTVATIAKRTTSGFLSSVFHPSLVMGQRIALIDTRNDIDDGTELCTLRYQLSNHLESVALELDGAGQVISYEEYHPYGTTAYQASNADIKAVAKRYRYTGKERDEESGFYYHGARYYICWLGRWLKGDPGGMVDGVNGFSFLDKGIINQLDLTGFNTDDQEGTGTNSTQTASGRPSRGKIKISEQAEQQADKSKQEKQKLEKLQKTAEELAERGFDVEILGEGEGANFEEGDLVISGNGFAEGTIAESKRLTSAGKNALEQRIKKSLNQPGKVSVIDLTESGTTDETIDRAVGNLLSKRPNGFNKPILLLTQNNGTRQL